MSAFAVSRRAFVAGLVAVAAAPASAWADAGRFRAIELDVSPLRRAGDTITADWIARDMPPMLGKSFAGYLAPGDRRAPVLRVRIDMVTLGIDGSAGIEPFGPSAIDWITGEGVVMTANGQHVASYPFQNSQHARFFLPDQGQVAGRQRIDNLAAGFAQWLPGKMGL